MTTVSPARRGIFERKAASGVRPSGDPRWAPLGVPGRPGGEDHVSAVLGRRVELRVREGAGRVVDRRVAGLALAPADDAAQILVLGVQQLRELVVVDQGLRALPLHDLLELGRREGGVQVQGDGADLRAGHRRLDEVAVVPAHDRHTVPLSHAGVGESPGERVRSQVGLGERERPELVVDRDPVGVLDRGRDRPERRGCSPADELLGDPHHLVGAHRRDHARLAEDVRRPDPVGDPGGHALGDRVERQARGDRIQPHSGDSRGDGVRRGRRFRPSRPRSTRSPRRGRSIPCPRWWSP